MKRRKLQQQMALKVPVESPELPPVSTKPSAYYDPCPPNVTPQEAPLEALIDRPLGDAGAGVPAFRATQFFWQVHPLGVDPPPNEMLNPFVLATARSYDRRVRLWFVSFAGRDTIRDATGGAVGPLPIGSLVPGLRNAAPTATAVKARVEVQDDSGRRFVDMDVLGSRGAQFYAWSVTVFALLPTNAIEVSQVAPQNNATFIGIVADTIFGAQISPTAVNSTQVPDRVTRFVVVAANTTVNIPVPPGSTSVEIHSTTTPTPAVPIQFHTGDPTTSAGGSLGIITFPALSTSTGVLTIPNALNIRFGAAVTPAGNFTAVFTIEM